MRFSLRQIVEKGSPPLLSVGHPSKTKYTPNGFLMLLHIIITVVIFIVCNIVLNVSQLAVVKIIFFRMVIMMAYLEGNLT